MKLFISISISETDLYRLQSWPSKGRASTGERTHITGPYTAWRVIYLKWFLNIVLMETGLKSALEYIFDLETKMDV